jgi:hypothetical protein
MSPACDIAGTHLLGRGHISWPVSVIELSVYELEKGGPLPGAMGELLVKRPAHGFRAGPFRLTGDDETPIKRGVM